MAAWRRRWNSVCLFLLCADVLQCNLASASECASTVTQLCRPGNPIDAANCTAGDERTLDTILQDFAAGHGCTVGGNETCCIVHVPPGEHTLKKDLYFGNKSLLIIGGQGSGGDTPTLRCALNQSDSGAPCITSYSASNDTLVCTWGFTGSDHVRFEGVSMEDCPGPVSIEAAARVDIVNSTFRYVPHIVGLMGSL